MKDRSGSLVLWHRGAFIAAFVVYVITAWNSVGYHSEDEHHQLIGFAQARMGELPAVERAWEYEARIRQSALPWVAIAVFNTAKSMGVSDPFTTIFALRLLTALLALMVVRGFVNVVLSDVEERSKIPFILLSYFLWFLPFLHVRFSSETWSGLFVIMALTALLRNDRQRLWALWAGAFLAIAIWIRPPVVMIGIGIAAWLVLVQKERGRTILEFAIGGAVVIGLSFLIDSLFYNTPTFSCGRYVQQDFAAGPSEIFDALPWYYYAPWVIKYAIPPIGAGILIALGILLIKHPRHVLVWCIVPFVLFHSFVPHKEPRFLYPLADLAPLVLVTGFREIRSFFSRSSIRWFGATALIAMVVLNLIGLSVVMTSPAGNGRILLAKTVQHLKPEKRSRITYLIEAKDLWRVSIPALYGTYDLEQLPFHINHISKDPIETELMVAQEPNVKLIAERTGQQFQPLAYGENEWVEQLMQWYSWGDRPARWVLYRPLSNTGPVNSVSAH